MKRGTTATTLPFRNVGEQTPRDWEPLREQPGARHALKAPPGLISAWANSQIWVQEFPVQETAAFGPIRHLLIGRRDRQPIRSWQMLQRVKNQLAGEDAVAVEVYPAQRHVIDDLNIYHLWVFPPGFVLPFGLHKENI